MKKILAIFTTLSVFLAVWQMTENRINVDRINNDETSLEAFLPTPSTIYTSFKDNFGLIISETLITLERAFAGFVSGFIMAVAIVALFSFFPILRHVGIPISVAINSFPIIGFSPIIILFFGQGTSLSIVFISMLISYFPILINLDNFVRGIPADIFNMMKIYNSGNRQIFLKLIFPLSIPTIIETAKLAVPASIIGATMGEWLGTRNGIGHLITVSLYQLNPGVLYASLAAIMFSSIISIFALSVIGKIVTPWVIKN